MPIYFALLTLGIEIIDEADFIFFIADNEVYSYDFITGRYLSCKNTYRAYAYYMNKFGIWRMLHFVSDYDINKNFYCTLNEQGEITLVGAGEVTFTVTYGETARVEVEFYSKEDWKEQIKLSQQQFDENSYDEFNLRVKSAKELVRYSTRLGNSLDSLLGTRKQDSLENLEDYVGSKGTLSSIL